MQAGELAVQLHGRAAHGADALRTVLQPVEQDLVLDAVGFVGEAHDCVGDVVDQIFDEMLEQLGRRADLFAGIERLDRLADRLQRLTPPGQQEAFADSPGEGADSVGAVDDVAGQVVGDAPDQAGGMVEPLMRLAREQELARRRWQFLALVDPGLGPGVDEVEMQPDEARLPAPASALRRGG